jgi:hypothetical protein
VNATNPTTFDGGRYGQAPVWGIELMSDDEPDKPISEADAQLQREIRAGREFSLADAIGRMAGPGIMKGVSPITGEQQAVAEIQEYLDRHLTDSAGVLPGVLLRQVAGNELLLKGFDKPLVALAECIGQILHSEYRLSELVREVDVEWGRMYDERPRFETEGCAPAADDPYTLASVRTALTQLVSGLQASAKEC